MNMLFILLLGIAIGLLIARGFTSPKIQKVVEERKSEKDTKKERIMQYLKEHGEITNDQAEELVGVSDTTIYRYLEELEQEGKIRQIGAVGRGVKYRLK
ncbi:MAG: winged helix-turn-helix transcriptional regulator [Patescibacteria group bacterium]|nr:winged helix-turn-helix transcriptional regulator [Patescibacteria group bacterium]